MRDRRLLPIALAAFSCLLLVALSVTAGIVGREGVGGVFRRKREALQHVMPDAVPVLDRIEERVIKDR